MGIFDLFSSGAGEDAAARARQASVDAANKGYNQASGDIKKYGSKAVDAYGRALPAWSDLIAQYQPGAEMYNAALGFGTPEDQAAARASFQASPGYEYTLNQGLDALNRTANSRGLLASGNNTQDLLNYAHNLSNNDYQQWLDNLFRGSVGLQQGAAAGQSGVYGDIGNAFANQGTNLANLATNKFNTIGQANSQYQQDLYGAQQGAAANQLGALMGGLQLGGQILGLGAGGGSTIGAKLFGFA